MVTRQDSVVSHVVHEVRPRRVEVVDVVDLTARMRRVTLVGDLAELPVEGPTDHLKVFFPPAPGAEPAEPEMGPRGLVTPPAGTGRPYREYTVRHHDGERLVIDMVRHGSGLAGRWIEDPRGALWLLGPRSSAVVAPRDWYLLGGDETALPALARWLEVLPADRVTVLVEIPDAGEERYLPPDAAVRWLHRDGAAPGTTTLLGDAVAGFPPPTGEGFCWMGAEASALRPVRRHLRDVLPAGCVDLDGYWRRGVAGTGLG